MEQPRGLLGLARELRDTIYEVLSEEEDLTNLMLACKLLRKEVLDRIPGGDLIDYGHNLGGIALADLVRDCIDVHELNIIAEP